ncbi:hypothetical protein BDR07DRAFT_521655 [Suillus spraguei]|nr:hypothetical protein BDR07DRAFT_521655 [Suillus spraguei]
MVVSVNNQPTPVQGEILALALNLIVTLCTESIGFVHAISLRSALASESQLRFSSNLRLLTQLMDGITLTASCLMVHRLSSSSYPIARPHSLVTSPHSGRRTPSPGDDRSVWDTGCQNIDVELLTFRLDRRTGTPHAIDPCHFAVHALCV